VFYDRRVLGHKQKGRLKANKIEDERKLTYIIECKEKKAEREEK
jgi:hypothetical protein